MEENNKDRYYVYLINYMFLFIIYNTYNLCVYNNVIWLHLDLDCYKRKKSYGAKKISHILSYNTF